MWSIIISFLWHLLSGEAYGLWKEHKQKEAQNVQNDVAGMPNASVTDKLQSWTRK